MRIKEIEARLAAIKQEIEERGDAMKAEEIDALENETKELTEERAGLIAAAEKRNGILVFLKFIFIKLFGKIIA